LSTRGSKKAVGSPLLPSLPHLQGTGQPSSGPSFAGAILSSRLLISLKAIDSRIVTAEHAHDLRALSGGTFTDQEHPSIGRLTAT
jgi:hypothetical protein